MPEVKCGFDSIPKGASGADLLIAYGPTLIVDIGFDKGFKGNAGEIPTPGITSVSALVDTGATESCIDDLLATQLNLPVVDQRPIGGAGGQHMAKIYLAQVRIPSLNANLIGAFAGVHLAAGGQTHKALIGRTFLANIFMTYDGRTGQVIMRLGK